MSKHLRPAITILSAFIVILGVIYPAIVTLIGQAIFPYEATGSIIEKDGKKFGSELIGQPFTNTKYLWSRPSATSPVSYNATASVGSNLSAANPILTVQIKERIATLKESGVNATQIPADIVTSSASGLDPHISVEAAEIQIPRIASARKKQEEEIRSVIKKHTQDRQFGIFGEKRVNVLLVNLELDNL